MRKAFKSSTIQDQQVLSKGSQPSSVTELHNRSDKPPPLNTLTAYRYCRPSTSATSALRIVLVLTRVSTTGRIQLTP